jgi:hypothetical protein
MNRRFLLAGSLIVMGAISLVGPAWAQRPADAKVRGDAYYFYTGEVYGGHAGDHAFLLSQYSSTGQPVPNEVVVEHAAAIRANVEAARKSYGKVSAASKKDPTAVAKLKEIEMHHAAALEACGKLDAEAAKATGGAEQIGAACDTIGQHLDAADEVNKKLLKQLKIPAMEPSGP